MLVRPESINEVVEHLANIAPVGEEIIPDEDVSFASEDNIYIISSKLSSKRELSCSLFDCFSSFTCYFYFIIFINLINWFF